MNAQKVITMFIWLTLGMIGTILLSYFFIWAETH